MSFETLRAECAEHGYIGKDIDGLKTCKVGACLCSGHSCPSKKYWNKAHKQPGYYKERALERTGLKELYEAEIKNGR